MPNDNEMGLRGNASSRKGQTFLTLVFIIGGLIAAVAITFVLLALSFASSGYGFQASNSAEAAATAGAEDALLQLTRNPVFSASSSYAVTSGGATANVTVNQNSPSAGYVTVLSIATVAASTRKVNVILLDNATTGETDVVSWQLIQ